MNPVASAMFLVFVAVTLLITRYAARMTTSSGSFYTAGGQLSAVQNGAAIAGDFMSAASFLGITGFIFVAGFDGLVLAIGAFGAWPVLVYLVAQRVRNLGSYTFIDVISRRLAPKQTRLVVAIATIAIVILYLIAQMVAAGKLVQLLFGMPYKVAVVLVSVLVLTYVTFGGMLATTWVQIVKALLLLIGVTLMSFLILSEVGFSLPALLEQAASAHPGSEAILTPGLAFDDPVQVATIMLSMLLGTLGLPHILMRFFTVPDMRAARMSAFYASLLMGYFYLLLIVIGFGGIAVLSGRDQFFDSAGAVIGGSNMTALHIARAVGGDVLAAFMAALSFATILAVVAGLTVSGAAAISHDLYAEVLAHRPIDPGRELRVTRGAVALIGVAAASLGLVFEHENVAFIAVMPMVLAASVTFPVLILSLYWRGLTTRGALAGAIFGLLLSISLIVLGPRVWSVLLGNNAALFPYDYPGLFTVPLVFLVIVVVSLTDRSERGHLDRQNYHKLLLQSEFGIAPASLPVAKSLRR